MDTGEKWTPARSGRHFEVVLSADRGKITTKLGFDDARQTLVRQGSDLVGDGRRVKQVQTKLGFDDARSSSRIPRLLVIFSLLCVVTRREPSRRLDAFVGSFRAIFAHNTEIGRGALQLVTLLFKMHLESGVLELQRVHSSDALRATARTLRWCLRWRCGHYLADL